MLKLGGASFVKVLMNARHHPFLVPTCTTNARTQRLVHTSVFAARWRNCLSAQAALSDFRGPFVTPFCVAWEEKEKKKKKDQDQDPASWIFPPPPTNSCVRVPSHPYCAILLCSRYPYVSQGRYRTIQCFVVNQLGTQSSIW